MTVGAPGAEAVTASPPAGLERRFYAFVVDRAVAWPLLVLAGVLGYRAWWRDGEPWPGLLLLAGCAVLLGAASTVLTGLWGATPGKAALGLRVVDVGSGRPIGLRPAALRTVVLACAGLPTFGLGAATLAQTAVLDPDRRRRGWHDRVAGSIVVDVRRVEGQEPPPPDEPPRPLVNLTALRLAPAPAAAPATPARRSTQASPLAADPAASVSPRHAARPDPDEPEVDGWRRRHHPRWRVRFDTGESLLVDGPLLVGRRPEGGPDEEVAHLVPLPSEDMSLSKTHAQVHVAPDGALVVTDRGSRNGSALVRSGTARALAPGASVPLLPGDLVRFGDRSMTVDREG